MTEIPKTDNEHTVLTLTHAAASAKKLKHLTTELEEAASLSRPAESVERLRLVAVGEMIGDAADPDTLERRDQNRTYLIEWLDKLGDLAEEIGAMSLAIREMVRSTVPPTAEPRCPECLGENGNHNQLHKRYPEGGGGANRRCSKAPKAGESK